MKKLSESIDDWNSLRSKIIGFGERSLRKSYYPELQRQLDATLQSEEQFRLLAENTQDGVLIVEDNKIKFANPRLTEILGDFEPNLSENPMVSALFTKIDTDSLEHGKSTITKFWMTHPDGRKRYLHVRCFRLQLDEFSDRLYVMLTDMTVHKLREAELERRVQERTDELQKANEKLKELDQLKNDFISDVSHDLRTPLTNIQLFSQLLKMNKNPEKQAQYWEVLQAESTHLEMLINDLLTLSRLEHGRFPHQRERTDLHQMITQELQAFQARIKNKQLAVNYDSSNNLPLLMVNSHQIRQVIANLLSNAIAYTPEKGNVHLLYTAVDWQESVGICLKVQNDGPPIATEELPNLFDRFYRGENARAVRERGTGLGLSICKQIVEQHGGGITIDSNEREGTTVAVFLPLELE